MWSSHVIAFFNYFLVCNSKPQARPIDRGASPSLAILSLSHVFSWSLSLVSSLVPSLVLLSRLPAVSPLVSLCTKSLSSQFEPTKFQASQKRWRWQSAFAPTAMSHISYLTRPPFLEHGCYTRFLHLGSYCLFSGPQRAWLADGFSSRTSTDYCESQHVYLHIPLTET